MKKVKSWIEVLIITFLGIISLFFVFLIYFYPLIFGCFDIILYIIVLFIIIFPIFMYTLLRKIWFEYWSKEIIGFFVIFIFIISYNRFNNFINFQIEKNGGIITPAIVIEKYSYYNTPNKMEVAYEINKSKNHHNFTVDNELYNSINIGDTVLIIYSSLCISWERVYDFTPTYDLIQECKEGCYYKDGKIVDEL